MDKSTFLRATKNVHGAKHGTDFIYVGNDVVPNRWWAFFDGSEKDLHSVSSLEEAKAAAHRLFDNDRTCELELEWTLLPETLTSIVELPGPDFV
jgi:hypothetical protein